MIDRFRNNYNIIIVFILIINIKYINNFKWHQYYIQVQSGTKFKKLNYSFRTIKNKELITKNVCPMSYH